MGWDLPLWNIMRPIAAALGLVAPLKPAANSKQNERGKSKLLDPQRQATQVNKTKAKRLRKQARPDSADGSEQGLGEGNLQCSSGESNGSSRPARSVSNITFGQTARLAGEHAAKHNRKSVAITKLSAQDRYDDTVRLMLSKYDIKVRKWRKSMSGVATLIKYNDGTVRKYLESPRPKSPMSLAIFLHEVGHHAIGVGSLKPRCLEEFAAWKFSVETMQQLGFEVTPRVQTRMRRSLSYAVGKAKRRGIRSLPPELLAYHDGKY